MRTLASSVLVFEWIVLALAIPVAVNVAGVDAGRAWIVFGVVSVLVFAALATLGRGPGIWVGWAVQVVAIAGGLVVPLLAILGIIFALLYFWAIRLGTRVDEAKAHQARSANSL